MHPEVIISMLLMLLVFGILFTYMNNSHKRKLKTHDLLEKSIDKGYELSPEILRSMNQSKPPRMLDLRRGIIFLTVGIAIFLFGWFIPDNEASTIFRATALFPICIGCGFLIVWKLNQYSD